MLIAHFLVKTIFPCSIFKSIWYAAVNIFAKKLKIKKARFFILLLEFPLLQISYEPIACEFENKEI